MSNQNALAGPKKEHLLKLNPVHFDPSEILGKSQIVPLH